MSRTLRRCLGPLIVGAALALAPSAAADPDIATQSAPAVIGQLRQEGYTVTVNGVSSTDVELLTGCKVIQIHHVGDPSTKNVAVDVACTISQD